MLGRSRKRNILIETSPLDPTDDELASKIIDSSEAAGVDKFDIYTTAMVGSAAWYLYGLKLRPTLDRNYNEVPRPGDVDFAASPVVVNEIAEEGTRSELVAQPLKRVGAKTIATVETGIMPVDFITSYRPDHGSITQAHQVFRRKGYSASRPIADTGLRIANIDTLMRELKVNSNYDKKAKLDYEQAKAFVSKITS